MMSKLLTIIKAYRFKEVVTMNENNEKLPPIHPGEILKEEFLEPMGISQYRIAKDTRIPAIRISEIVRGKRSITPETAVRLGMYFNMSPQFWLNLQAPYDLEVLSEKGNGISVRRPDGVEVSTSEIHPAFELSSV